MNTSRKLAQALMMASLTMYFSDSAVAKQSDSLAPDLAVNFQCSMPPSEAAIEQFLTGRKFTVANLERMRRQFNLAFYPLEIEGYDQERRFVHFIGLPSGSLDGAKITYSVGVNSPPPTRHDAALEKAVLHFITTTLKCKASSVNHGSNPTDASAFYDEVFALQLSRDHEAATCDKMARSFDARHCERMASAPVQRRTSRGN
ncbi:MAG: hypothetical protein P4L57_01295 [Rhizomicrobium sp.]|nr:hypothetical protein [Rhizomicrobium sp.]